MLLPLAFLNSILIYMNTIETVFFHRSLPIMIVDDRFWPQEEYIRIQKIHRIHIYPREKKMCEKSSLETSFTYTVVHIFCRRVKKSAFVYERIGTFLYCFDIENPISLTKSFYCSNLFNFMQEQNLPLLFI